MEEQHIEPERDLISKVRYTIGDVAKMYGVEVSTIRYWEKEFPKLRPRFSERGIRRYTRKEIEAVGQVHHLLKERGLRIESAKRALQEGTDRISRQVEVLTHLKNIRQELESLRSALGKWERQSLVNEALQELQDEKKQV